MAKEDARQKIIDLSQKVIRRKLRIFLQAMNRSIDDDTLNSGHCNGLSSLMLYCLYQSSIQKKPKRHTENFEWLQATLNKIASWNEKIENLSSRDKANFDRLIGHIIFLQKVNDFLPVNQGELHKYMEDTRGRKPLLEYTLAGLFRAKDFTKKLNIPRKAKTTLLDELLKYDKRLILISRGGHTMALFKNQGQIAFYNPSSKSGVKFFPLGDKRKLIDKIFAAYNYKSDQASPFGFRIFTFSEHRHGYSKQRQLLASINGPVFTEDDENKPIYSALKIAARIGSKESLEYYLSKTNDVDGEFKNTTALYTATGRGYTDIVRILIKHDADPYKLCQVKKTPLQNAELHGHQQIVNLIQKNKKTLSKPINSQLFFKPAPTKEIQPKSPSTMLKV